MEKALALYVSAAPEMDAECERLGQLLAEMTPAVRWGIKRTPASHAYANPDLDALRDSHFYLILMGTDIVAPIGVELRAARQASVPIMAYRKADALTSPAAAVFLRDSQLAWQAYGNAHEFVRHFERALIARLIEGTPGYGLALTELAELSQRLAALDGAEEVTEADERRGAGRGGVILPRAPGAP